MIGKQNELEGWVRVSRASITGIIAIYEVDGGHGQGFVVGHQAEVAAQPGERALDDPTAANELEAAVLVRAFDDLDLDRLTGELTCQLRRRIAAIGK